MKMGRIIGMENEKYEPIFKRSYEDNEGFTITTSIKKDSLSTDANSKYFIVR